MRLRCIIGTNLLDVACCRKQGRVETRAAAGVEEAKRIVRLRIRCTKLV